MKKLLCILLVLGLAGCSSKTREVEEVKKDEDYYLELLQGHNMQFIDGDYYNLYGNVFDEDYTINYLFSIDDNDNYGLTIEYAEIKMEFYVIDNTSYLYNTSGHWYICEDDTLFTPAMYASMDFDDIKDFYIDYWDEYNETDDEFQGTINRVENNGDANMVNITDSDGENYDIEFDADSDQIISITILDDEAEAIFSVKDDDWQSQVIEETKDIESTDENSFYQVAYDSFEKTNG